MRPEYGNPLFQHVFEMSTEKNIDWILNDISLAIRINEPRLYIHSISANKEKILEKCKIKYAKKNQIQEVIN